MEAPGVAALSLHQLVPPARSLLLRIADSVGAFVSYYLPSWGGGMHDKRRMAEAIAKLRQNLAFLDEKTAAMETSVARYAREARALYLRKNTTAAVHQIRLKKMYEREMRKMDSMKFNIESNILHIESVGVMMETVCTIKETSDHFQIVQRHVDLSKLEDTIEEMCEQRDASHDIESILSDMHTPDKYDDDELLAELAATMTGEEEGAAEAETAAEMRVSYVLPLPPPTAEPCEEVVASSSSVAYREVAL